MLHVVKVVVVLNVTKINALLEVVVDHGVLQGWEIVLDVGVELVQPVEVKQLEAGRCKPENTVLTVYS